MSGSSYRSFLKLLERWPVDPTKAGGRDLGEYLRTRIAEVYRSGASSAVNEEWCGAVAASLHRLAADTHKESHPRSRTSTALGLSPEEYRHVLSNEGLQQIQRETRSWWSKKRDK